MDSITLQKQKLQQKMNRLKQQEARLRVRERKYRIHQLIQAGEMIEKAQLLHLTPEQLYGALLSLKKDEHTCKNQWQIKGQEAISHASTLHRNSEVKITS